MAKILVLLVVKKIKKHPWENAVSIKFLSVLWAAYYQKLKNIWKSLIFILAGLWPPHSAYVPSLTTGSRLSAVRTCLLLIPHVQLNVAIFSCHTQVTQAGTWSLPSQKRSWTKAEFWCSVGRIDFLAAACVYLSSQPTFPGWTLSPSWPRAWDLLPSFLSLWGSLVPILQAAWSISDFWCHKHPLRLQVWSFSVLDPQLNHYHQLPD